MATSREASAAQYKHLAALRAKHAELEDRLHEEQKFPATASSTIRELKLQKLRIKEAIEQEQRA